MRKEYRIRINGSDRIESGESSAEARDAALKSLPSDVRTAHVTVYVPGNVIMKETMVESLSWTRSRSRKEPWKRLQS